MQGFTDSEKALTRGEGEMRGSIFTEVLPPYDDPAPRALIAVRLPQGFIEGYDVADGPEQVGLRQFVLPATLLTFTQDVAFFLNGAANTNKKNELRFWAKRADGCRTVSYKVIQSGDDVYVTPREQNMMKVSLHASGVHQESHLEPFWSKVSDGGSRHLERWSRPDSQPGEQVRLFKIVLPAREMVYLNPLKGENDAESIELNCGDEDDVVEVSLCYVQHATPSLRRGLHGIKILAEWAYLDGVLVVMSETGKIKDHELALIAEAGRDSAAGYTEGPRAAALPAPRTFLSLTGSDGVRGWMEIRDQRPNPPPALTFKR